MIPRLGVNIDHVATLRQARDENYPSLADAAKTCFTHGADQITIHLREDRRHIQDADLNVVHEITKANNRPLNLEMGCSQEIIEIAIKTSPEWICLVPENRQERTTEGGLNLADDTIFDKVNNSVKQLKAGIEGVKISLFLEANSEILSKAKEIMPEAVEIHTGDYARSFLSNGEITKYLIEFREAKKILNSSSIACHAGHGLTYDSVVPLLEEKLFEEYNIGHWIICASVFEGLGSVVKKLKELFNKFD